MMNNNYACNEVETKDFCTVKHTLQNQIFVFCFVALKFAGLPDHHIDYVMKNVK
jgi:hypothetical protein